MIIMKYINFLPLLLLASCTGSHSNGIYDITDFGAKANSPVDNAAAIQKAIDRCSENGGGTVRIPAGKWFMAGPFQLKSFVNLHLEPNSKIIA